MKLQDVLTLLRAHSPDMPHEAAHLANTLSFVERETSPWHRGTVAGHLTASAWIINSERTHTLLVHHRRLDRWFQPGGHIEDDTDLLSASLREAMEESGLQVLTPQSHAIFDIDVHPIPANPKESGHLHYDIRFAFRTAPGATPRASAESKAARWFSLEEVAQVNPDPSLARMVSKTRRRGDASALQE
jgi:8-oxo-dGTP pyrophosphatase MutT (NUDIX family)